MHLLTFSQQMFWMELWCFSVVVTQPCKFYSSSLISRAMTLFRPQWMNAYIWASRLHSSLLRLKWTGCLAHFPLPSVSPVNNSKRKAASVEQLPHSLFWAEGTRPRPVSVARVVFNQRWERLLSGRLKSALGEGGWSGGGCLQTELS